MNEAAFWSRRLRKLLLAACADCGYPASFERVENSAAAGTPDVDYCVAGVAGKIELKYAARHPVRPTTPVLGRGRGLRRSQIAWAARWIHTGGRVFLCIGTPGAIWILDLRTIPAEKWREIELMTAPGLTIAAAWHSGLPSNPHLPLTLTVAVEPGLAWRERGVV